MRFSKLVHLSLLGLGLTLVFVNESQSEIVPRSKIENVAPLDLSWDVFYGLRDNDVFTFNGQEYSHADKELFVSKMPSKFRGATSWLMSSVTSNTTLGQNPSFKTSDYNAGDDYVTLTYRYVKMNALRSGAAKMGLLESKPAFDLTFRVKLDEETKAHLSSDRAFIGESDKTNELTEEKRDELREKLLSTLVTPVHEPRLFTIEEIKAKILNAKDYIQEKLIDGYTKEIFNTEYFFRINNMVLSFYESYQDEIEEIEQMEDGAKKQELLADLYRRSEHAVQAIDEAYDRESDNVKSGGEKTIISDNEEVSDSGSDSESDYGSDSESEDAYDSGVMQPAINPLLAQIRAGKQLKDAQLRQLAEKKDGSLQSVLAGVIKERGKRLSDSQDQDDSESDFE